MAKTKTIGAHKYLREKLSVPDDTPIVDAKQDLPITVMRQDVRWATQKEPSNCGYARAICRETGARKSVVYRTSTYLLTEREDKPVVLRYLTNDDMRVFTKHFDRTGRMAEHEVTLKAPRTSQRLPNKRKRDAEYKAKVKSGEHVIVPRGPQEKKHLRNLRPRLIEDHA